LRSGLDWKLLVGALLAGSLGVRLWGIAHGLPYVYNIDENANFVPRAVAFFSGDYNPHYFANPPAFTYLLHGVFAVWFGHGWPFGAGDAVSDAYATDPTQVFLVARVTTALLGTGAVWLLYLAGRRLHDRRVGLVAAALLGVAFLPVFYSHLALNDVPALAPLALSLYGSAGILTEPRRRDYAIAGLGLGLAVATKYTAGVVALPLAVACAFRLADADPAARRDVLRLAGLAAGTGVAAFLVANPHALLSFTEFERDVRRQQGAASDLGKLGLNYDSGVQYYLWALTWGIGWLPVVAAAAGAALAARHDLRRALFLVPWPVVFIVVMGVQDRYFGRWLLPALPAVALLAAFAVVRASDLLLSSRRLRSVAVVAGSVLLMAQGLVYGVHVDRVLSRDDTRNLARDWMVDQVPAGSKIVVEPIVPGAWFGEPGVRNPATASGARWRKFITTRTTIDVHGHKQSVGRTISVEDYERVTRPALVGSYERGGFCWVMIGSTQYGRALRDPVEVPRAIDYYRTLARHGDRVFGADPYKSGERPVAFNFDWSFDYYPMAYERPGPTVLIYRLHEAKCAGSARPPAP
jgi:hypothetical protein